MSDNRPLQKKVEEHLQELIPDKSAPTELKSELEATLDQLEFASETIDLYIDELSKPESEFLKVTD